MKVGVLHFPWTLSEERVWLARFRCSENSCVLAQWLGFMCLAGR